MAIALLALVLAAVALYLHLWKAGYTGTLSCTSGRGSKTAMLSPWGWFLGVDVALVGTIGYILILGSALWGMSPRAVKGAGRRRCSCSP